MTTATSPKLSAKDKAFRKAYGHLPSECLPGCIRPRTNGQPTHRQSLKRPGDMAGKPFTETWEAMKARKAARAAGVNGPVVVLPQAPTGNPAPIAQPVAAGVSNAQLQASFTKLFDNLTNTIQILEIRIAKLEPKAK